jgi:hypothetical protein
MHELRWSWRELEETPLYVRQFCWDFIMRRRRVQNEQREHAQREGGDGQSGTRRVKW